MRSYYLVLSAVACVAIAAALPAYGQFFQEGAKLAGSGASGTMNIFQGSSVALSGDGNTALVGGPSDNGSIGAVWVFTRFFGVWLQQGNKLAPNDASGKPVFFGQSLALSSDGNTALIGGSNDNGSNGAAWVFTRSGSTWSQQGSKLVGSGASGPDPALRGISVALSSDGNTALVGGPGDSVYAGAAWVFTRSGSTWTQQGNKLATGDGTYTWFGNAVALSADGNTALIGESSGNSGAGEAWVFTRSNATWSQQGTKLTGTGASGNALQGMSVALSGNGETALVGGVTDNTNIGAAWVFTLSGGVWSQQGSKLVGSGYSGQPYQGVVALSSDGNIALVGGPSDNNHAGAVWVFSRSAGLWTQQGNKLVGSGASAGADQGNSVALSSAGDRAIIGGPYDNLTLGAAWVFAVPALSVSAPAPATSGTPFNITVTAQDGAGATVTGYTDPVHFTSTDSLAILPADATLTNGAGLFPVTLFTAGNQTITATDTVYTSVSGTSGTVNVPGAPPRIVKTFGATNIQLHASARLSFKISNPNTTSALSGVGFTDPLPAGLVVASPNGLSGQCGGGTIRAVAGSGKVSLSGAAIAAQSSCTFSVKVTGKAGGAKNNVTSAVVASGVGKGNRARATLTVVAPSSVPQ